MVQNSGEETLTNLLSFANVLPCQIQLNIFLIRLSTKIDIAVSLLQPVKKKPDLPDPVIE